MKINEFRLNRVAESAFARPASYRSASDCSSPSRRASAVLQVPHVLFDEMNDYSPADAIAFISCPSACSMGPCVLGCHRASYGKVNSEGSGNLNRTFAQQGHCHCLPPELRCSGMGKGSGKGGVYLTPNVETLEWPQVGMALPMIAEPGNAAAAALAFRSSSASISFFTLVTSEGKRLAIENIYKRRIRKE